MINYELMMRLTLILTITFFSILSFGQNKEEAEKLVDEGINHHDNGDYEEAIIRYDKALQLDKDNLSALAEKALTLYSIQKYDDAISYCQQAIEKHSSDKGLKTVYVTYGNSFDALNKANESIKVYDEGIKNFPDYYQLYFNKGITLFNAKKIDEAISCFQKSVGLNPEHASSNNALARLMHSQKQNIPALLAICRFLIIEPLSKRAEENLVLLQTIMKANVEQTGEKAFTINVSPKMLENTTKKGNPDENSFSLPELVLSMGAALDYDAKNSKQTEVEQFIRKFEAVVRSLKEIKEDNHGFYWDYYVPYFTDLNDEKLIEPFAYIAFASSDKSDIREWLDAHKAEISKFYEWDERYWSAKNK